MKRSTLRIGMAAVTLAVTGGAAAAVPVVSIGTSGAGAAVTAGLSGFTTLGDGMVGMRVTGYFADTTSEVLAWAATGAGAGGVSGGFSVAVSGDTFSADWVVSTRKTLTGLLFEGQPGDTLFDRSLPAPGTAGSANGADFTYVGDQLDGSIRVLYSRPLAVLPAPSLGDTWVNMLVELSGLDGGGLGAGQTLRFVQDTDNVALPGDIRPVPVPGALPLLGTALAGLCLLRWRRRSDA
jgi:hypothetical protein